MSFNIRWVVSSKLNQWCWRWHVIAGLCSLPFIMLLTITGILYLFKEDVNHYLYGHMQHIEAATTSPLSYQQQLKAVVEETSRPIESVTLPNDVSQATAFRLKGKGRTRHLIYINPYTGELLGEYKQQDTLMYKVRKLHGELLLDTPGTLIVELVASWFIVLLITGIVIWWPSHRNIAGVLTVRFNKSKRIMWRDLHGVMSFWVALILLVIIVGAMPWTDIFGANLKQVQKITKTGYPKAWRSDKGIKSIVSDTQLSLDKVVAIINQQQLEGTIEIKLSATADGPIKITNRSFWLSDQKVIYLDQYSGGVLTQLDWGDVGILMDLRQVFMRLHQGEYGRANWWILLIGCLIFLVANIASIIAYLKRKPTKRLGIPARPESFKVGIIVIGLIALLAVVFPMFGVSLLLVVLIQGVLNAYNPQDT